MLLNSTRPQSSLPGFCPVEAAVASMAAAGVEERGAVFTRREVVEFILDLVSYTADRPLHQARILEPAVGQGDFLLPTIDRLLDAYARAPNTSWHSVVTDLSDCLYAVELHRASFDQTRSLVIDALRAKDIPAAPAAQLADRWLHQGDFLLLPLAGAFSHVVGNPPYVRQERIPDALMEEYRRRYRTIYDRADLYVPFIERSLLLLAPGGQLGFICADRWMKNRYGGPLRRMVAERFHLKYFVDMVDTPAFNSDVIAYPAIVVISREEPGATRVAFRPEIDRPSLVTIVHAMAALKIRKDSGVTEVAAATCGAEPWVLGAAGQLGMVRRVETELPTIEEAGCKVGIGVATGADQIFIGPFHALDVEPDRKLPLAMTRDILTGMVKWRGFGVINPFADDGSLVPLRRYPRLAAYLERHDAAIKARHVSKKNPGSWYRTIDRIYPELTWKPKLLIPDIKGQAHIVYEAGELYPHHNLYFVTSSTWDLHALQAVLLSDVTRLFMGLYSTRMRGGYLRFQAQYLRRLRVPHWRDVPSPVRIALAHAGQARDLTACSEAAATLYRLTPAEREALAGTSGVADAA
ncbi:MAG TPA: Eco57I restriction-modification methylase domain-containing protein [Acetobacteraceae bacterium]|nr:Eco57I restriction-modification methylase domain-containing protein [Acetobacteraceae bacterium]